MIGYHRITEETRIDAPTIDDSEEAKDKISSAVRILSYDLMLFLGRNWSYFGRFTGRFNCAKFDIDNFMMIR